METRSEEHLVLQTKLGDTDAFAELAQRYYVRIYQMILSLTKNQSDADDLAQETFMQAFRSINKFKQRSSFFTWIYRIGVNVALTFLKKNSRKEHGKNIPISDCIPEKYLADEHYSPEKRSLENEIQESLRKAVDCLPLLYKSPFILVEFQGMTHHEAAQVLCCSENTVSWRMHQARKQLQDLMRPYFGGGANEM